jgi:hypothetical protein
MPEEARLSATAAAARNKRCTRIFFDMARSDRRLRAGEGDRVAGGRVQRGGFAQEPGDRGADSLDHTEPRLKRSASCGP